MYIYIYTQDLIVISFEACQIKPNDDSFFHACCFSWHIRHSSCNKGVYHLQVYATGSFEMESPPPTLSQWLVTILPRQASHHPKIYQHPDRSGKTWCLPRSTALPWMKTSSSDVSELIVEVTSKNFWTRTMLQSDANTKNWLSKCFCWDHLRWRVTIYEGLRLSWQTRWVCYPCFSCLYSGGHKGRGK